MPYVKPLDQIGFSDIEIFLKGQALEWTTLELKRDFNLNDVVETGIQFSNSYGGILLFGVEELRNTPPPGNLVIRGVSFQPQDQDSILNKLRSSVHPGILPDVKPLMLPSDPTKCIWFIRFRESEHKPHWDLAENRVWIRYGSRKALMDPRLIHQAFSNRGNTEYPGPDSLHPFNRNTEAPPFKGPRHSCITLTAAPANRIANVLLTQERDQKLERFLLVPSSGAYLRRWNGIAFEGQIGQKVVYRDYSTDGQFVAIEHNPTEAGQSFELINWIFFLRRAIRALSGCLGEIGYYGAIHIRFDIVPPEIAPATQSQVMRSLRMLPSSSSNPNDPLLQLDAALHRNAHPFTAGLQFIHTQTSLFAELEEFIPAALGVLNRLLRTHQVSLSEQHLTAFLNSFKNSQ